MVDSAKIPLLRRFGGGPGDLSYRGNIIVHTKKTFETLNFNNNKCHSSNFISVLINVAGTTKYGHLSKN